MEKSQLWTIIGVTIVVAVIASLATVSLTGNTIKVWPSSNGTDVYTKGEIDTKFLAVGKELMKRPLKTELGATPKNCNGNSFSWSASKNGTAFCKENLGNSCLISEVTMTLLNPNTNSSYPNILGTDSRFISCDYNFDDFDEDDEMGSSGLVMNVEWEVICCSP